jgi:hypothetical protein
LGAVLFSSAAMAGRMETGDNDYGGVTAPDGTCYPSGSVLPCSTDLLIAQTYLRTPVHSGDPAEPVYEFQVNPDLAISNISVTLSLVGPGTFFTDPMTGFSFGSVLCEGGHPGSSNALCWMGMNKAGDHTTNNNDVAFLETLDPTKYPINPVTNDTNTVTFNIPGSAAGLVFFTLVAPSTSQQIASTLDTSSSCGQPPPFCNYAECFRWESGGVWCT